MISILIADDHGLVREGMQRVLESHPDMRLCAQAADGEEALRAIEEHHPDVAVLDVGMPRLGGLETLRLLRERFPGTRTLLISVRGDPTLVDSAIRLGADGYLLKASRAEEVVEAIRAIASGGNHFSVGLAPAAGEADPGAGPFHKLSTRELEVLRLIAEGLSAKSIAAQLSVSPKTVEAHRSRLLRKLGMRKATELVRYAVRYGLLEA
jgi:two-component system, NarL family, invasion response regulator UvrY